MNILFLHGFPFNASAWQPQIDFFAEAHRVLAPNLRGHGDSVAPPGPWMIHHFADDIEEYMNKENVSSALLCGLSMGGYVALNFALRHPARVIGLALCNTRADGDSNEAKDKRYENVQRVRSEGTGAFAKVMTRQALADTTLQQRPDLQAKVEQMVLANKPENIAMTLGALASRRDETLSLPKIQCPTAVFVASEDKIIPAEVGEAMARSIVGAKLYRIKQAGHLSNLEKPDVFNQALHEFIKGVETP